MFYNKMKRFTPEQAKMYIEPFWLWLEENAMYIGEGDDNDIWDKMVIMDRETWESITPSPNAPMPNRYLSPEQRHLLGLGTARTFLIMAKWLAYMYVDYPNNTQVAIFIRDKNAKRVKPSTVMKNKMRLPKIEYLLNLTPDDFFTFIKLLYCSKTTPTHTKLILDFAAIGYGDDEESLEDEHIRSLVENFLIKSKVNYSIRADRAMAQWISREELSVIVEMEPTRDNQLSALQFIIAYTVKDINTIPTDTAIELELDWEQTVDERYVIAE